MIQFAVNRNATYCYSMLKNILETPNTAGGSEKSAAVENFGDKRAVADLAGMSVRWVDGQLLEGLPHLKLGPRRVRFDLSEVREWFCTKYAAQRRGKLTNARPQKAAAA